MNLRQVRMPSQEAAGPSRWRDALRRVRLLGPCGLSRKVAEQEAAMTEHGPPLDAALGLRPRGTVALHILEGRAPSRPSSGALRFIPYGGRTRGGHDRAWPSIGCRLGPAATRDRGPPCWRDALRRVRLLGPCGLSRMVAEQEAAMTEHGPPLDAALGLRPRGTVALHVGGTRSVASVFRR
jgi:hypothetical protein